MTKGKRNLGDHKDRAINEIQNDLKSAIYSIKKIREKCTDKKYAGGTVFKEGEKSLDAIVNSLKEVAYDLQDKVREEYQARLEKYKEGDKGVLWPIAFKNDTVSN